MFDREREIEAWTRKAYSGVCRNKAASREELADHLLCEMERLESEGHVPEEAFRLATAKLAGAADLISGGRLTRSIRNGRIANGVIWGALFVAITIVLAGSVTRDKLNYLLLFVLLPCWYASDLLLIRYLRATGER